MTDARMASFFDKMVRAEGVVRRDIDFRKSIYRLRFVNKGVGLDLRPEELGQEAGGRDGRTRSLGRSRLQGRGRRGQPARRHQGPMTTV